MDEAGFVADELAEMGEEGDDVVFGDGLDLVDAGDVELDVPAFQIAAAAYFGMTPRAAWASAAWASISNQMRKRVAGSQIFTISGRE